MLYVMHCAARDFFVMIKLLMVFACLCDKGGEQKSLTCAFVDTISPAKMMAESLNYHLLYRHPRFQLKRLILCFL